MAPVAADGFRANLRGAGFMMLAMAGFSANDAMMKTLAGDLPLAQAIFLRGCVATALIGVLAWRAGALVWPRSRRDRRLIGLRCVGEIGGAFAFLTAVFNMPLAGASAILQSLPLAMTLSAALILGEPVGWRRYLAIAVGFVGVLVIVRPGAEGFNAYALSAVAAVGLLTLRDLSTRMMSPDVRPQGVVTATSLAITLAAGAGSLFVDWGPVGADEAGALVGSAALLLVGYFFGVLAMREGEIGFVQPFRYTLLVWAMLLGIVVFGEWPDAWMLAGAGIVVATGLFTLYRERVRARMDAAR